MELQLEISKEITDLARVSQHKIVSASDHQDATTWLALGKGLRKKIQDYFAPLKQDAHASWKRICDRESEELAKITPSVMMLDRAIVDYRMAEERKRLAAEAERRRQEAERRRLEEKALREAQEAERRAEAEKRRIAEEARLKESRARSEAAAARAREEAARRQEEADRKAKEEQDRILSAAAAEESKLEPVVVVPEKITTPGTIIRHNWKFRVTNLAAVPIEYHLIDEVRVGKLVRASEGKAPFEGIEVYDDPTTVSRG